MVLDDTDLRLLRLLQRDGRASYEALAREVGLSRTAARMRTNKLLDSGRIRVRGVVRPEVTGITAVGHVSVAIEGSAEKAASALSQVPDVVYLAVAAGRYPLAAELRTTGMERLADVVGRIRALPMVRDVDTLVYSAILRDRFQAERPYTPTELDTTDHVLLRELQQDGRMPFSELAVSAGLSAPAARARVLRLLEAGVVHVGAMVVPGALGVEFLCGFLLAVDDPEGEALSGIARSESTVFLARCMGRGDAVGTVMGASLDQVLQELDRLRSTPGVRLIESWMHLHLAKETYETDFGR